MVKAFLADLWVKWRTLEGLPVTLPYVRLNSECRLLAECRRVKQSNHSSGPADISPP